MNRIAILILSAAHQQFASARSDLAAIQNFLRSETGGCWLDSEIVTLVTPTTDTVLPAISRAATSDYSLVYFIGPISRATRSRPWAEIEVKLLGQVTMSERELNPGTPRCMQIFDGTMAREVANSYAGTQAVDAKAENSRGEYSRTLGEAEAGLVRLYSQSAQSDISRHSLTHYLITAAVALTSDKVGEKTISAVAEKAQSLAFEASEPYSIHYAAGRRLKHFPFATKTQVHPNS